MGDDPLRFEEAHDPKGAVYFQVECLADVSIAAATIWLGWSLSPTKGRRLSTNRDTTLPGPSDR